MHGLDSEWKMMASVVEFVCIVERHTQESIHKAISNFIGKFEGLKEKIVSIVTDGGSNFKALAGTMGILGIDCACHRLQLSVKRTMLRPQLSFQELLTQES